MKQTELIDAIGELPEELIAPVAELRKKKPVHWVRWVVLAACICLALLPFGWQGWRADNDMFYSKAENAAGDPPMETETARENYGGLADNTSSQASFRAEVLEVHDYGILVRPLEGEEELRSASKIEVYFSAVKNVPEIAVGDTVEIFYSGMIQETYPARVTDATKIRVVQ